MKLSTVCLVMLVSTVAMVSTANLEASMTKSMCMAMQMPECSKFMAALESQRTLDSALAQRRLGSIESMHSKCQGKNGDRYWCYQVQQADKDLTDSRAGIDNAIVQLASRDLAMINAVQVCQSSADSKGLHCSKIKKFVSSFKSAPIKNLAKHCRGESKSEDVCQLMKQLAKAQISPKVADRVCQDQSDSAFCSTLHFAQQYIGDHPKLKARLREQTAESLCEKFNYPFCDKEGNTVTSLAKFDGRSLQKLCTEKPELLICKTIALAYVGQLSEAFLCQGPGSSSQKCGTLALAELELKVPRMNSDDLSNFNALAKIEIRSLKKLCKRSPKMMICSYVTGGVQLAWTGDTSFAENLKAVCMWRNNLAVCDKHLVASASSGRLVV